MGVLEVLLDWKAHPPELGREQGIWQWRDLMPIDPDSLPKTPPVGDTPMIPSNLLANHWGVREIWIKDDGRNPTSSFKDRASVVALAKAKEFGFQHIYTASTGNAASSLAGLSATAGVRAHIFIPHAAPQAKLAQLLVYGAQVFQIQGTYDQAFDLSLEYGQKEGWYCRNSAYNPYLLEGKKTASFEIFRDFGNQVPDIVLVGVGDGTVYSSIVKGFFDLKEIGWIDRIPVVIGVQAKGSNAVLNTFQKGEPFFPIDQKYPNTIADSICVGKPRDVLKACLYAKKSGGFFVEVEDREIAHAIMDLARTTGVFSEPAGAVSYAGLQVLSDRKYLHPAMKIVLINTGNGLKDTQAFMRYCDQEIIVLHP